MHLLVKTLLAECARRGAPVDPVQYWDDLVDLDLIAHGLTNRPQDERHILLDRPIHVGNVTLRRLSEAALEWLADVIDWWGPSDQRTEYATAWALCCGRSKDALDTVTTPAAAWSVIRAWRRTVHVPVHFILDAAAEFAATSEPLALAQTRDKRVQHLRSELRSLRPALPEPSHAAADALLQTLAPAGAHTALSTSVGPIYAALVAEYHDPLEHWLFDVSSAQVDLMLDALILRRESEDVESTKTGLVSAGDRRRLARWTAAKCAFLDKLGIRNSSRPAGAAPTESAS
jgi:hypothetical protein